MIQTTKMMVGNREDGNVVIQWAGRLHAFIGTNWFIGN